MSVEITSSTAKLSCHLAVTQGCKLLAEAINIHLNFLTQSSRRGWLTVCLCQHWYVLPFFSVFFQLSNQLLNLWIEYLFESFLNWQRHTCVVDVLWCQSKVDELLVVIESSNLVKLLFDEIFNSLYIVVGDALNFLHTCCRRLVKVAIDIAQLLKEGAVKAFQLW